MLLRILEDSHFDLDPVARALFPIYRFRRRNNGKQVVDAVSKKIYGQDLKVPKSQIWETKFSSYDFGAEFSIYRKRNIYIFVYKTVWLI